MAGADSQFLFGNLPAQTERLTRLVYVTSILFEDDGEQLGYTVLEDITRRKRAEQKAQRLYEAQEVMLYSAAHDLKKPLLVLHTLTGFIQRALPPEQTSEKLAI